MHTIIMETSNGSGAAFAPGPFIFIAIVRWLWRKTKTTGPDGTQWTRGEVAQWERYQRNQLEAWNKEQKRIAKQQKQ